LPLAEREAVMVQEVLRGNVPEFLRALVAVANQVVLDDGVNSVRFWVTPDYLAVGSSDDYFLAPMTPVSAQLIADATGCVLPTRRMVDVIHRQASLKLEPQPIPPSAAMTTVGVFRRHNEVVITQRLESVVAHPLGTLVAGHKKDVVISPRLATAPGKVAIYGWHQTNGTPVQPLYLGHTNRWVDYSHGIRLVQSTALVNEISNSVEQILMSEKLSGLLSNEGSFSGARYAIARDVPSTLSSSNAFGEVIEEMWPMEGVRGVVNSPRMDELSKGKPLKLVIYGLPNGNTIEQTAGRQLRPGDDWHFGIQHIAAQMRFVRAADTNHIWVVAYLEAAEKSWPAWRKKHADSGARIVSLVEQLHQRFAARDTKVVLTGHSGGGSFIFGYLNAVTEVPDEIERIAFLEATYAYDPALKHAEKLNRWLKASRQHCLTVLAYNDAVALLDGKSFVSATGGTWFRSQLMQTNLAATIQFTRAEVGDLTEIRGLDGRVMFLLKENPDRRIYHTVQVERNGLIHCLLAGTSYEGRGYEYFGHRAYEPWIER